MNLNKIIFLICFVLALGLQNSIANEEKYWGDFIKARSQGKVKNAVDYVDQLATRTQFDTLQNLDYKKQALAYFFATGGKNGFRKTPLTVQEKEIVTRVLVFTAVISDCLAPDKIFNVLQIRRTYGRADDSAAEKKDLIAVQKVLTATRMLIHAGADAPEGLLKELYEFEYFPVVFALSLNRNLSETEWDRFVADFSQTITKNLDGKGKNSFQDSGFEFSDPGRFFGLIEPVTPQKVLQFQKYIQTSCRADENSFSFKHLNSKPRAPIPSHRPMKVLLENGLVIERSATGATTLTPTRNVSFGGMNLGPGSVMKGGTGLFIGPLQLSNTQTEAEFLRALSAVSAILSTTYL